MINKKRVFGFSMLLIIIIMGLFLNSFYWPYEGVSIRKILVALIVVLCLIVIPIASIRVQWLYMIIDSMITQMKYCGQQLRKDKKRILQFVFEVCLMLVISIVFAYCISRFLLHTAFNIRLFYVITTLGILCLYLIQSWKDIAKKVEQIFVVFVLCLGIFCIGVTPDKTGVSWDDQIHYQRTLAISNFFNGIMYDADEKNIGEYVFQNRLGYDRESNEAYEQDMQILYETKACKPYFFKEYGVWSVSYIPSAIGVVLGRGLGLSYMGVFNMGRLFNLLTYAILIFFAIKRIKYGKVLIATIGLIPTSVFMAASYSYDPWVTGFTILGFSYFFAELQEESLLETKNLVIMVGALALGCIPKAIYFPILLPLLFMPKRKFKDSKQRKCYYIAIITVGLLLVSSFLLPMIIEGPGTGDARGGSEVNSTEQIAFILQNPLRYAKILFKFGLEYIGINNSAGMMQAYAYAGSGTFYGVISLLLIVLAFLDRGETEKNHYFIKTAGLLGCAVAMVLSITALYISFTAVASDTVAGMQGRYMIPTIYPALYCLGVGGTKHTINKNVFTSVPMLVVAFTMIYNLTVLCVIPY